MGAGGLISSEAEKKPLSRFQGDGLSTVFDFFEPSDLLARDGCSVLVSTIGRSSSFFSILDPVSSSSVSESSALIRSAISVNAACAASNEAASNLSKSLALASIR